MADPTLAVIVLIAAIAAVLAFTVSQTTEVQKPSAETVARLKEEGVPDPEGTLNEREEQQEEQDEVTPSPSSRPVGPGPESG